MKIDYRKQKGLGFHQVLITTKQADRNYCILQGIVRESKRDLAINQVPITTKLLLAELLHKNAVTQSNYV